MPISDLHQLPFFILGRFSTLTYSVMSKESCIVLGTDINVFTGEWINQMAGVGAGQDSFYEYLLKVTFVFYYAIAIT